MSPAAAAAAAATATALSAASPALQATSSEVNQSTLTGTPFRLRKSEVTTLSHRSK